LDEIVDGEKNIRQMTHIPNVLRFWDERNEHKSPSYLLYLSSLFSLLSRKK